MVMFSQYTESVVSHLLHIYIVLVVSQSAWGRFLSLFFLVFNCTFRASCYSTCLSWAHTPVINWVVCLGQMVSS